MLTILVTLFHVGAAGILITFILLHAGRGGGLSDMFGGGMSLGGSTVVEKNLDRMTVVAASMFFVTTISLGFIMQPDGAASIPDTSIPGDPGGINLDDLTPEDLNFGDGSGSQSTEGN